MKRTIGLVVALAALLSTPAQATVISFQPSTQTVDPGDLVFIDIEVSDLGGEIVSAYDLDVAYDPTILTATSVDFGSFLGAPLDSLTGAILTLGNVNLAELSFLSDLELESIQMPIASFAIARITFQAVGPGTTSLEFVPGQFGFDLKGRGGAVHELVTPDEGEVTVRRLPPTVPEPATFWLALGALALLAARRRG